jgi:F0F1-type ATP synthase assembly protein I
VIESPDDRSSIAEAWAWVSRITSVALEMVLPGVLGYWLDQKLGTVLVFLVLGVILGMAGGLIHLVRMTQPQKRGAPLGESRPNESKLDQRQDKT